jgi:nitrite reductase (NADH) small subunit
MSDWRNPTCSERGNFGASDEWLSSLSHEEAHMGQFIRVASTADLAPGETRCVEASGKKIALFNLDGSFYAIDNTCTHRGGPLCEGGVSGGEVTCPWHGAVYNFKTGAVLSGPAPRGVASYAVRVQGSAVEVEV